MLTSKQIKIFGLFGKNIFKEYTFKELKGASKSHSLLQNAIRQFKQEDLIFERKIGTSKLYKLNHSNDEVYDYLKLHNQDQLSKPVKSSIRIVKEAINKKELFYVLVIFGSYSDASYSKKSDLDLAVFISDEKKRKQFEIALNSASNKTILDIDYHIIAENEFGKMLTADYENLGKQIATKNLPIYNASIFYRMLIRATKYGFDPISSKSRMN